MRFTPQLRVEGQGSWDLCPSHCTFHFQGLSLFLFKNGRPIPASAHCVHWWPAPAQALYSFLSAFQTSGAGARRGGRGLEPALGHQWALNLIKSWQSQKPSWTGAWDHQMPEILESTCSQLSPVMFFIIHDSHEIFNNKNTQIKF